MYRDDGAQEDFEYLKYYGRRLSEDLEHNFECRVHIHRGSAFLLMGEDCHIGTAFPGNNAISDILLLCCRRIRQKVEDGSWEPEKDDKIIIDKFDFERLLGTLKQGEGSGFTKNYRQMPEGEFVSEVMGELERWTFIRCDEREHQVVIYPSAGKMAGHYPDDYVSKEGGTTGEQQMAGK
jgi:hypothetical protein